MKKHKETVIGILFFIMLVLLEGHFNKRDAKLEAEYREGLKILMETGEIR